MEGFDPRWTLLESHGLCDGLGGMQYQRVLEEWLRAGSPAEVDSFIVRRANSGPRGEEPSPGLIAAALERVKGK